MFAKQKKTERFRLYYSSVPLLLLLWVARRRLPLLLLLLLWVARRLVARAVGQPPKKVLKKDRNRWSCDAETQTDPKEFPFLG